MRLALSCAALLALAAPVAAQSNAERVVNDAYTRSHDYDLVHQRIEVRNFDWDSTSLDRKSTRLNSSHLGISYAVFCLKKKKKNHVRTSIRSRRRRCSSATATPPKFCPLFPGRWCFFFFFNDPPTPEISTLSLHDALPI